MKNVFLALLSAAVLVAAPAIAKAGGGSKNNGQVVATNNSSQQAAVFLNSGNTGNQGAIGLQPGTDVGTTVNGSTIQSQFTNQGGQTLNANGGTFTFRNLAAGTYTVTAEFLNNTGTGLTGVQTGNVGTRTFTVNKGQTVTVSLNGNNTAAPTITVNGH